MLEAAHAGALDARWAKSLSDFPLLFVEPLQACDPNKTTVELIERLCGAPTCILLTLTLTKTHTTNPNTNPDPNH